MKAGYSIFVLFVSLALFGIVEVCNARGAHGFSNLSYNYYRRTCPRAEKIVRGIIRERARTNPALGAKLIRMQFHDCFVRVTNTKIYFKTMCFSWFLRKPSQVLTLFLFLLLVMNMFVMLGM